jgi:hypothetical protein
MRPSGLVCQAFALSHGVRAANDDGIGIVDDTVTDGVSQSWFADFLVLATHFKLGAEDGESLFVPALRNLSRSRASVSFREYRSHSSIMRSFTCLYRLMTLQ